MTALPIADPERAIPSTQSVVANPVRPANSAQQTAPAIIRGSRGRRSASWAIGTCNARAPMVTAARKVSVVVRSRPNASRISGSRIPNAVRSSSSTALSPNRITSGYTGSPPHTSRNQPPGCRTCWTNRPTAVTGDLPTSRRVGRAGARADRRARRGGAARRATRPTAAARNRHSLAGTNHRTPHRNIAPSTAPANDPRPPTTDATNTSRLSPTP